MADSCSSLQRTESSMTCVEDDVDGQKRSKEYAYDSMTKFYSDNEEVLKRAAEGFTSNPDRKAIDACINGFQETSKIVISGLDSLADIHPFIAAPVFAFKLVLSLDLSRRENNDKVVALRVTMQEAMCTLFQLRDIRNPQESGPYGTSLQARFQDLLKRVEEDIRNCGSDCDVYAKKGVWARTLKSKQFESRLAGWGNKFIEHKANILTHIHTHTALQISSMHDKVDRIQETLHGLGNKLDMATAFRQGSDKARRVQIAMMDLLAQLDTPKEKDIKKFIAESGGAEAVVEDEDKVLKLANKTGESIASLAGDTIIQNSDDVVKRFQTRLKGELAEDVAGLFSKNIDLFGRKLDMISIQIKQDSAMVVRTLSGGSHDRITDDDLKAIWKEMGWKGSVKGRHFVLMLKDYFSDKEGFISKRTIPSHEEDFSVTPILPSPLQSTPSTSPEEKWALRYITIANLQPVSEAIDDDATGFVNVSEVNVFAADRPAGWSMVQWLAYWAAGHHLNMEKEEKRLKGNLAHVNYQLDEAATVSIVAGNGRIEKHSWPLVYLVLRRLQAVFSIACKQVLDWSAFSSGADPLWEIFDLVDERVSILRATFQHANLDPDAQLTNFAFGMFQHHFPRDDEKAQSRYAVGNTLWEHIGTLHEDDAEDEDLKKGLGDVNGDAPSGLDEATPVDIEEKGEDGIEDIDGIDSSLLEKLRGPWTGHLCSIIDGRPVSITGFMELRLKVIKGADPSTAQDEQGLVWKPPANLKDDSEAPAVASEASVTMGSAAKHVNVPCIVKPAGDPDKDGAESLDPVPPDLGGVEYRSRPPSESASDEVLQVRIKDAGALNAASLVLLVKGEVESMHGVGEVEGRYESYSGNGGVLFLNVTWPSYMLYFHVRLNVVDEGDNMEGKWYNLFLSDFSEDPLADESKPEPEEQSSSESSGPGDVFEAAHIKGDDCYLGTSGFTTLSRTPAHIYCHYPRHDEFLKDRTKALWSLARAAIMSEVKRRVSPWRYTLGRVLEANSFIKLEYRRRLSTMSITPRQPLTDEELSRLRDLRYRFHHKEAMYVAGEVEDNLRRMPWAMGYQCNWCRMDIAIQRYVCINCIPVDWYNTIDLCPDCVDKFPRRASDGAVHIASHSLLRHVDCMHMHEYQHYIPKAQQTVKQTKATFRDKDQPTKNTQVMRRLERMQCHYCRQAVKLPCWVCLDCENDTYICKSCDIKESKKHLLSPFHLQSSVLSKPAIAETMHSFSHTMIRITDSSAEQRKQDSLVVLRDTIDRRLKHLETSLETRMTTMESMLSKLFTHVTGTVPQPETLTIPLATPKPRRSPVERSRSRMGRVGRRASVAESELSFKEDLVS
ncbi:hypothetical protein BJ165DRAFT_1523845 [Panaeolus papilionaceus]|nr:hypothetical protein BJ165DRAFT_1523845 [Panaeolus papilionaceus]